MASKKRGRSKSHKDVHFEVGVGRGEKDRVFRTFDQAAVYAVSVAASGETVHLDVIVWSRAGAKWLAGDDGVERYNEDVDRSVFERLVIRVDNQGSIA